MSPKVLSWQSAARARSRHLAVFNALRTDKPVRHLPNFAAFAADDNYFQTIIVVQMDVECRENFPRMFVLMTYKRIRRRTGMMIVNNRYGRNDSLVFAGPLFLDQKLAHKVAQSFRPVRIMPARDRTVELLQQVPTNTNAKPLNTISHIGQSP
jgi:hypothetical protein